MMKGWLPWVLKGGFSAGLIAWVLSKVDLGSAWSQAKAMDHSMLAVALGLMLFQIALGAVRWQMVLRALDAAFSFAQAAVVYYIGAFFSLVLPGAVGGDAVRMWYSRKAGLPLHTAVNSVMLERAVTVYGLVLLVCMSQPLLDRGADLPGDWIFQALLAVCTLGILFLSVLDRLPQSLRQWRLVRGMAQLAQDTRSFFFHPGWGLSTLSVAVLGHVNLSLAVYVLAVGLGLGVTLMDCLVLVPPVILVMTLPISIAGWGVRETAMVTAFGFIGIGADSAVVLSVLFGIVTTLSALPGGVVFLLSGARKAASEMEEEIVAEELAEDDEPPDEPARDPETVVRVTV